MFAKEVADTTVPALRPWLERLYQLFGFRLLQDASCSTERATSSGKEEAMRKLGLRLVGEMRAQA